MTNFSREGEGEQSLPADIRQGAEYLHNCSSVDNSSILLLLNRSHKRSLLDMPLSRNRRKLAKSFLGCSGFASLLLCLEKLSTDFLSVLHPVPILSPSFTHEAVYD